MKMAKYLIAVSLLLASSFSHAIVIEGREWRPLADTDGFSWQDASRVCSRLSVDRGICDGSLSYQGQTVNFTGWRWASTDEVASLFSFFNPNYEVFTRDREVNSTWAPAFFDLITSILSGTAAESAGGLTRTTLRGRANYAFAIDRFASNSFDEFNTIASLPRLTDRNNGIGIWLYRDAIPVPEPSTYLLMGLGLIGLTCARRRKTL